MPAKPMPAASLQSQAVQQLAAQGAKAAPSGMRQMDLSALTGGAMPTLTTPTVATLPTPTLPAASAALQAARPMPSVAAPAVNMFPGSSAPAVPPSLQGKPAGDSLQAAHDLLAEMETGMTQGWESAKARVSAAFGALGQALVARETALLREMDDAMFKEAALLAKRKGALQQLTLKCATSALSGVDPTTVMQLESFKTASETDQHRWQARRVQVTDAEVKTNIAQVGVIYSAASGEEPPEGSLAPAKPKKQQRKQDQANGKANGSKQTNKQAGKQPNKQASKQPNKQGGKQGGGANANGNGTAAGNKPVKEQAATNGTATPADAQPQRKPRNRRRKPVEE
eukprot:m.21744 g.21744  ORF g.21744 m.21744 type:complete len:341 (+) comp11156_c0_seq16:3008-4030(+)